MRKLALSLLLLVGVTLASITSLDTRRHKADEVSSSYLESGKSNFRIEVDEGEITEIIEDFKEFSNRYLSRTEAERIALLKKLRLAFKNTAAKLLLNFGRTIPPLVSSWASVMKGVQVNPSCDQTCAVECLDPLAGCETMYFNPTCLQRCKCHFSIERMDPEVIRGKMDEVTKNADNVSRFFKDVNAENMRLVRPSYEAYMSKASKLHEEFGELVKEHVSKVLGCDESCLEDCLDEGFVSFFEVPKCLKHCKCKEGLISIERESGFSPYRKSILGKKAIKGETTLFGRIGEEEEEGEGFLEFMRHKKPHHIATSKGTTLFSNIEDEEELKDVELFGKLGKEEIRPHIKHYHKEHIMKGGEDVGYDWSDLMRYSDYDKKAWNFFKKYEEDI